MPQSLVKNYIHLVFSTKNRQNLIHKTIQSQLYAFIVGVCKKLDSPLLAIGGTENHIHILCSLSKKIALAELVKNIKAASSHWLKGQGEIYKSFYWQRGYGAFSVNPTQISIVETYIHNQEEHHRTKGFQDELKAFLQKYQIVYDEHYLWD